VDWWCWGTSPYPPDQINSNVTWATGFIDRGYIDPYSDVQDFNAWDWESARKYYLAYLTGLDLEVGNNVVVADEQRRNQFLTYTFRALGQLMHLIQDTAVPAHVRNDFSQGHTRYLAEHESTWNILKWFGNPFEDYVRRRNKTSWFDKEPDNGDFLDFRITDLWDANILRADTTPDQLSQINMSCLGLAEYTSINFLSMFTMFKTDGDDGPLVFPYPKPEHCVVFMEKPQDVLTNLERQYLANWNGHPGETIYKLAAVGYLKYFRDAYFPNISNEKLPIALDDNCYEEYAQKLIPRAIGYSADLLDYFFRGQLSVTTIPRFNNNTFKDIKLNIQNTTETQESMLDGNFFLLIHYKKENADVFVRADHTPYIGELAYQDSIALSFKFTTVEPIFVEEWKDVTFTLAFQGTMGNEIDAVVGKVFKPEVKDLFIENWENGIDKDKWQNTGDDDDDSTQTAIDGHLIMESTQSSNHDGVSRINSLVKDFTSDGSDGILITQTTYFQFNIPIMESFFGDHPEWANHALLLHFNDDTVIEYSGDGRLHNWTSSDLLIPHVFDPAERITDNIHERFEIGGHPIPDPLYLKSIQFMQLASFDTLNDYYFYMDVDDIRLFDTQWEE
jgi:hypothetical protein